MSVAGKKPHEPVMIHTIDCSNAKEFLDELLPTDRSWLRQRDGTGAGTALRYRGVSDAGWRLQPTAFRTTRRSKHFGKHFEGTEILRWEPGLVDGTMPGPMEMIRREMHCVHQFSEILADTGLEIPFDCPELGGPEAKTYTTLKVPPPIYRGMFALAQHYGISTRLLDWTTKPLVAAYFAAVGAAQEQTEESRDNCKKEKLAVWAFNLHLLYWLQRETEPGIEVVTAPSVSNPNLNAQGGMFTLVRFREDQTRADTELPPDLDALVAAFDVSKIPAPERERLPALVKLTLPCTEARRLLYFLFQHGVSAAQVFPGHAGAARSLTERRWWSH